EARRHRGRHLGGDDGVRVAQAAALHVAHHDVPGAHLGEQVRGKLAREGSRGVHGAVLGGQLHPGLAGAGGERGQGGGGRRQDDRDALGQAGAHEVHKALEPREGARVAQVGLEPDQRDGRGKPHVSEVATARTMIEKDSAPGSGWPTERSARGRALPTLVHSAAVARAACSAASAAAVAAAGSPSPTAAAKARTAGSIASYIVLSPSWTRPRERTASAKASAAAATSAGPGTASSPRRVPRARSAAPHSTPEEPPACSAQASPAKVRVEPRPAPAAAASRAAASAASRPRTMPRPWSPSPATASAVARSSSAARTAARAAPRAVTASGASA